MASLRQKYGFVCKNTLEAGPSESRKLIRSVNNVLRSMYIPPAHCITDIWFGHGDFTEDLIKLAVSNAHAAFRIGDIIHPCIILRP
ncbi:unnamed protein product [Arabis nemorensis]|uniref:Uncharacterized protein n=1 Tax=Arabis nemorensis TaxID=586526 RepID=A0A565CAA0_9BRAS|nr:unnamed protein product [Arabis nemorensis]